MGQTLIEKIVQNHALSLEIDQKVKIPINSDTPSDITKATAKTMIGLSNAYKKLKPDIIVLDKLKPVTKNIIIKKNDYCKLYDGNIYILYSKKNSEIKCD